MISILIIDENCLNSVDNLWRSKDPKKKKLTTVYNRISNVKGRGSILAMHFWKKILFFLFLRIFLNVINSSYFVYLFKITYLCRNIYQRSAAQDVCACTCLQILADCWTGILVTVFGDIKYSDLLQFTVKNCW